ncbi:MAG: polyphenol oxidase family protein [Elusimicrobia bacterium]|nr:polyphenol oxidase family protein [Elusimicrobiota bacterium]
MPEATVVATDWTLSEGLFTEPRLAAAGLRHGMTGAALGDMTEPERRAALAGRLGIPSLLALRQVHGTTVERACTRKDLSEADGWVSTKAGLGVGVFAADCLPLLFWTDDGKTVGAFHAGWRGLADGMAESALKALADAGAPAARLNAAVGPHIGSCCYEVGAELEARFSPGRFSRRVGKLFLDLGADARARLEAAGLAPERVSVSARCTACSDEFFSWRRDRVRRSMMAFVVPA